MQFGTPIANAWTLHGDTLNAVDLFDKDNVPALSCEPDGDSVAPPLLYIGTSPSNSHLGYIYIYIYIYICIYMYIYVCVYIYIYI